MYSKFIHCRRYIRSIKWAITKPNALVLEGNDVGVEIFEALASDEHEVYTVQEGLVKSCIKKTKKGYEMFTIRSEVVRKRLV